MFMKILNYVAIQLRKLLMLTTDCLVEQMIHIWPCIIITLRVKLMDWTTNSFYYFTSWFRLPHGRGQTGTRGVTLVITSHLWGSWGYFCQFVNQFSWDHLLIHRNEVFGQELFSYSIVGQIFRLFFSSDETYWWI